MSFSPNHRCQGTEGNTKHWPNPVVCPRSSWSSTRLMVEGALLCCGLLIKVAVSGRVDLLCCLNAKVTHTAAAASTLHRYITSCGIRRSDDVRRWRETVVGTALVFLLWVSVTAHLTCNTVHTCVMCQIMKPSVQCATESNTGWQETQAIGRCE